MIYPFDIVRSQMFITTVDIGQDPHQTRIFAGKQHELHQYGDTRIERDWSVRNLTDYSFSNSIRISPQWPDQRWDPHPPSYSMDIGGS